MTCKVKIVVYLVAALCTVTAFAQVVSAQIQTDAQAPTSKSPVAFVYVLSSPIQNQNEINAFAAASNGNLTAVEGSPFLSNAIDMAVNGKYLFATDTVHIYSYSIASNGSIEKVASINALKFNQGNCGEVGDLFLDRAGATLYDFDYHYDCANRAYQSFRIDPSTGTLSYLGRTTGDWSEFWFGSMSFIANNRFAYQATCIANMYSDIYGFRRGRNGKVTDLNKQFPYPKPKQGDNGYCPYLTAADATGHVAISVQAVKNFQNDGPPQLATYTANACGDLTTKSTYRNMPSTADTYVYGIAMSPSGELLAVGGDAGLQVFHFNGSNPITHYTGLLVKDEIDQVSWDNDNHLYASSYMSGKLFVFTITPTSHRQAPGSPYAITKPQNIAILPKM